MAANKEAIGILFEVEGGGDINSGSGQRINKQLKRIVSSINNSSTVRLKFQIDSNYFNSEIKRLKEQIKKINDVANGSEAGTTSKNQKNGVEKLSEEYKNASQAIKEYYGLLTKVGRATTRNSDIKFIDGNAGRINVTNEETGYKNLIAQYNQAYESYLKFKTELDSGKYSQEEVAQLNEQMASSLNNYNISFEAFKKNGATSWGKLADKASQYVNKVRESASRDKSAIALLDRVQELANKGVPEDFDKLNKLLLDAQKYIHENNLETETWFQKIKETFGTRLRSLVSTIVLGKVAQSLKDIYTNVVSIDSAMTQLQIVTGASGAQMERFFSKATSQAKELGASISDVLKSIETFSRLGYTLDEASTLSKYSTILSNVAGVSLDEATTGLTSIVKGYGLNVNDAEHIADVLIKVGQEYAVSASEMMEAYEKSGAALSATGTSFEKSAGLIAAANAAVQNASVVGTALKTVSARIRGATTELSEMGEEQVENFSKYAEEIKNITGFSILVEGTTDTYKDQFEIYVGIAKEWNRLSDTAKARVAEILGGTRQLQVISSILTNISDATGAFESAINSAGTAVSANEKFVNSIQGKINQLKASFEEFSAAFLSSDIVKGVVDLLKFAVNALNTISNLLGGAKGTLIIIAGLITTIKLGSLTKWFKDFKKESFDKNGLVKAIKGFKEGFDSAREYGLTFTSSLKSGFSSAAAAAGALQVAVASVTAVISAALLIYNAIRIAREERTRKIEEEFSNAEAGAKKEIESLNRINELIKEYNSLSRNEDGFISEESIESAKKIEEEIVSLTKDQGSAIDLVNKNLEDEKRILDGIVTSQKNATEEELRRLRTAAKTKYFDTVKNASDGDFKVSYWVPQEYKWFGDQGLANSGIELDYAGFDSFLDVFNPLTRGSIIKYDFDTTEEFIEQYKKVNNYLDKFLESYNPDNSDSSADKMYSVLTGYVNYFKEVYDGLIGVNNMFDEINKKSDEETVSGSKGYIQGLKSVSTILKEVEGDYDTLSKALKDMSSNGQLSAESIKALFEAEKNFSDIGLKLYDETDKENSLIMRTADGYTLCEDALIRYTQAKIKEYTIEKAFNSVQDRKNAVQNLRNLRAVLDTLALSYSAVSDKSSGAKDSLNKQKDALKDQLSVYKELIDLRKNLLKSYQDEMDYQRELEQKQNNVARLQQRLAVSQLDDSAAGRAMSRSLADELAKAQKDLDDFTLEHAIDVVTNDLDNQYAEYERFINGKIDGIEKAIENMETSSTSSSAKIAETIENARAEISNAIRTVMAQEIVAPIEQMDSVVLSTKSGGGLMKTPFLRKAFGLYHSGGLVGEMSTLGSSEQFAKLLKGEYVATPSQMDRFMRNTLPSMIGAGGTEINAPLVEIKCDNVTSESMPKLKEVVNDAVDEIKKLLDGGMSRSGYRGKLKTLNI